MFVDPNDFTAAALDKLRPTCGECGKAAEVSLAQGPTIYPGRPDLWTHEDGADRWWWLCSSCWAYCGVHKGTLTPLGIPAGEETRKARQAAHAVFDPLCEKRQRLSNITFNKARGRGYKWLAAQMGIAAKDCHIGGMTADQARRVVVICKTGGKTNAS